MIRLTTGMVWLFLIAMRWISGDFEADAQALPVATQTLQISVFGGLTATNTGLASGGNGSVTVGSDFGLRPIHRLYPSIEVRSTYVLNSGTVDGQKNVIGGLKLADQFGRFHPYGNLLIGRGSITYGNGYQVPDKPIFYTVSHGNVISVGGGVDYELTSQFSVKFDAQYQRYATPVTTSGHLYSASGTAALCYRFNFNKHGY